MPMAAFDTMSVAKRLQDEFEMPQKQAEGVAVVLHENFVGNVATKDDIRDLREALDKKIEGLATKDEVRAEVATLGKEIFRQMLLMSVGIVGLTVALIKLLP